MVVCIWCVVVLKLIKNTQLQHNKKNNKYKLIIISFFF